MIKIIGVIRLVIGLAVLFQYSRFGYEYFTQGHGSAVAFGILSVLFLPYFFYCIAKGKAELKGYENFRATFSVLYAIAFQILFLIAVLVDVPSDLAKKDHQQLGFALLYLIAIPIVLYGDFRTFRIDK